MTTAQREDAALVARMEAHCARWPPAKKKEQRSAAVRHAVTFLNEFPDQPKLAARYLAVWNERNDEPLTKIDLSDALQFAQESEEDATEIIALCAADIEPEPTEWLWEPYVPIGTLTMLEGEPNIGKTFFACAIASALSRGRGLPGVPETLEPAKSLLIVTEDDASRTIVPRLIQLGADRRQVHIIDCEGEGNLFDLNTEEGIEHLEREIEAAAARFVFLDPILTFIGKTDSYKDSEVRRFLRPLCQVANRQGCALMVARHLNKSEGVNPATRGTGSAAWWSRARSALLMGKTREAEPRFAFVHTKNNLSPQAGPTLGYGFDPDTGFTWIPGPCDISAGELLAEPVAPSAQELSRREEASEFLRDFLARGKRPEKDIMAAAKIEGISTTTLKRAKKALGVISRKVGAVWFWELP